jgi:3-isopropylmalate/(R)-2-methylmalate dehydratase small subunit
MSGGPGIVRHEGVVAPLREDNVNTDAIIPSREMRRVGKTGLGEGLFAGLRYASATGGGTGGGPGRGTGGGRTPDPGFVLNDPARAGASILLSGRNFGCGSSREHAVWALRDFGFRAVLAQGFGGIFLDNCVANGVVPVELSADALGAVDAWSSADPQARRVAVDLGAMRVEAGDLSAPFALRPDQRRMLVEGLSPIDVTLEEADEAVAAFDREDRTARPWLYAHRV